MADNRLHVTIRTPREAVLQADVSAVRVPTETGQVGIRPRAEAMIVAVEPGLTLIRDGSNFQFVGTAGGLLRCTGTTATLLTPLAISGANEGDVLGQLHCALQEPNVELEVRATLSRLQSSILHELREPATGAMPLGDGS